MAATGSMALGLMYHNGCGVPRRPREAIKWYRIAAEEGHAEAQHNLGTIFANGEGVGQDLVQAFMWFGLAASKGIPLSAEYRDKLVKLLTAAQIDEARQQTDGWHRDRSKQAAIAAVQHNSVAGHQGSALLNRRIRM